MQCESEEEVIKTVQQITDVEIENPSDDDDDIPLISLINDRSSNPGPIKSYYNWYRVQFQTSNGTDWKDIFLVDESWYKQPPSYFFSLIIDNDLIRRNTKKTSILCHAERWKRAESY